MTSGSKRLPARWLLVGVLAAPLVVESKALAEDEAVARFQRGVQLYDAENFEGALVEWSAAYKISKNYKLLYNIAICQTAMKDYTAAAETFKQYLADGGSQLSEARKADVRDRLAKLALMVTHVRVTTDAPAGSSILVDDRVVGTVPVNDPITVKIGRRQFTLRAQGRTLTKTVEVSSGEQEPVTLSLAEATPAVVEAPRAAEPPPRPPPLAAERPSFPWPFWTLTALLGGGTAVTGVLAVNARNDFEEKQATYGISRTALEDDRGKAQTFGLVTDVLLVGTVIAAGVSTYLTIRYLGQKKTTSGLVLPPSTAGYSRSF